MISITIIFNLASQDTRPLKEFVQEIIKACSWSENHIISRRAYNLNLDILLRTNTSKIEKCVKGAETSFELGIEQTILTTQKLVKINKNMIGK